MHNRRWWGVGLLGIALAGTIALVIPSEAQTGAMLARNDVATRQPDRAVQQEAQAIASRIEGSMRRSGSLLQTLAEGDLAVFERDRVGLNAGSSQWPVALFTAAPGKGSDVTVQPPGEGFLGPEDVEAIQKQDLWISERSPLKSVLIAVPSRTGQVLASRVPFSYFTQGLSAIPRANGVRRYLLDVGGKAIAGEVAPSGEDRDWCQQLLQLGEGFLATSDAMFAVARVPSTGWAVVVRYPIGNTNPILTFDAGTLGGPTMVASGPLQAPGLPKGILLYPLAGAALLFGLAIVGWKQRWPGLEDGPIAFGENALKTVTAPLRDRFDRRSPAPDALPASSELGVSTFAAEVPSKLPAAIAGGDVDFLRTEQVRNLRELWSHTEERLSGQRNWVREEVRRVQDSTTTSISELGSIVNLAEQRLEDARSAWGEVQVSLLARIDEARGGLASEQQINGEFRTSIEDQLASLRNALSDEQEAREEQGKRLAKGLGDLASGLESETTDRSRQDQQVNQNVSSLEAALEAERQARGDLQARLDHEIADLKTGLASEREAHEALSLRLERDLDALSTLMNEEFARLEGVLQASRALLAELDAREADSRSQWQSAMAAQVERSDRMEDDLAKAREALLSELADQAKQLQGLVTDTQSQLGSEMAAIADRTLQLGESLSALEATLGAQRSSVDERLSELQSLVQEALPPLRKELEALRELSGSVEQISYRLDAHAERFEGLSALEQRLVDLSQSMDKRFGDLDSTRRALEERLEAAHKRVLQQADELEETNERLYDLSETLDLLNQRVAISQDEYGETQASVESRLQAHESSLTQLRQDHEAGLTQLRQDQESGLNQLRHDHEGSLNQLREDQESGLNQLRQDREADLARLRQDQEASLSQVQSEQQALGQRLAGQLDALGQRTEKLENQALQRLDQADAKLSELLGKTSEHDKALSEIKAVPSEFAGLKGRLEGMSMAHARQQEALNAAIQQLSALQQAFQAKSGDTALQGQVEELTQFVHQLAEQSQLLAQALEASTSAASRTESWLGDQLSQIRNEQSEAVTALTQENAALRASLQTLKESNEALSNRMHMVVQVLSKISK